MRFRFQFANTGLCVRRLGVIAMLMVWCVLLIAVRVERTGSWSFVFLIWNLFLAGIPLAASTLLQIAKAIRLPLAIQAICFGLWLLFFPNAPYLLTDLIHLGAKPLVPVWYDLALLLSFAGTGLLLGYLSLVDVQEAVTRRFGAAIGWIVALCCLLLSGFGIYLGRFLRWNSWEIATNPSGLFYEIADRLIHPWSHPRTMAVTAVFGIALALGYIALRLLFAPTSFNRYSGEGVSG
jgi:uncharacterized membrane protein